MDTSTDNRTPATATIRPDGSGVVVIDGRTELIAESTVERARARAIGVLVTHAAEQDRPVSVVSKDPSGTAHLVVNPNGNVEESTTPLPAQREMEMAPEVSYLPEGAPDLDAPITTGRLPIVRSVPTPTPARGITPVTEAVASAAAVEPERPTFAAPATVPEPATEAVAEPAPVVPQPEAVAPESPTPVAAPSAEQESPAVTEAPAPAVVTERPAGPARRSFIEEETAAARAERGMRGALNKVGFRFAPNAAEASERADIARVSQHWSGPRTIAIVNGKGGASKTPNTAMLSAVFARNGGSGVLAWDNNETRGTLGWRTEQGQHEATVQALLPNASTLMSAEARASDLTGYLHHQVTDKYDVLRSNPNILAEDQRLTMNEFDAIHSVAAKYFRLIFIDSGNDESADRWRRMIDRADQIVIATTARGEHAEAGALLLEALRERGEHSAQLARDAVVVVSQADHKGGSAQAEKVADGFRSMARAASVIPFDPAMRAGKLSYDALKPETQPAWLAAAAAVAQGL